jgi:hypothetical protein
MLLLLMILGIGGSAAYLTAYRQNVNQIAAGHNTTRIEETFPDPDSIPIEDNPEYEKTVWVSNCTGGEEGFGVDCYVRVRLLYSNSDIGRAVTLKNLNTTDWVYEEDGYYYYKHRLKEGESTKALFTGFSIDADLVEDTYSPYIRDFSISVYEESVQAEGFSDYTAAWFYFDEPL